MKTLSSERLERCGRLTAALLIALGALLQGVPASYGQSIISSDVTGTVTDPTGAVVANAAVTLTNVSTSATNMTSTNKDGTYRFAFVPPGNYKVTVSATGFQTQEHPGLSVAAGQPTTVNVQLALAKSTQTVDVVETSSLLQTENADSTTTFNRQMVENLPNPGGDITYIAQTAPGVVMNTQSGYGNFVADGMPATSNLFTINGQNYNDPFFGINNSGASNLLLGSNDIEEANVINSPYSAQYGQYAGSQITYITKSGTNQFHGDAIYMWNGRALNANQFFSNSVGSPTPFNNFNQWQTGVQGPIWKNHTFFDVDYEGLQNVLPTASALTLVPSPQYQAAALANLAAIGQAAQIPFYNQVFSVYNNAPGVGAATPVAGGGCQDFTGLPAGVPCALQFRTTPGNTNHEYQWSARVDHNFSDKDRAYIRVLRDNGFQPTFTSPFGPTFNAESNQPQMSGQVSEIHSFGPNTVNQFSGSALFYAAVFTPSDPSGALETLPTFINFAGTPFTSTGAYGEPGPFFFPQGRRVFQYQIIDDFSHVKGKHTFRMGFSWLHDNITDLDFQALGGPINGSLTTTLGDFYNGGGANSSLLQAFPTATEAGFVFNTFGGYVADDWKASDRLTVSLNLRLESYANPSCDTNCFSRLATSFTGTPDPNAASTPYNTMILSGQHNAYPNTQAVVWEPRIGIAWRPYRNSDKTVIRTGAGIFADEISGGLAENAAFNTPGLNAFTLGNGMLAPGVPGSLFTTAAQANQALLSQFASGGSFNSISNSVPGFVAPNFAAFPQNFHQPTYYKWNFEVQQDIGWHTVLDVNYVGMHGTHIPVGDQGLNAYCPTSVCPNGFAGLPAAPANAAFAQVTQYMSAGVANYDGLTLSLQKRLSAGLSFNLNYTWSHALDDVSNGGVVNEPFGILATNESVTSPQNPFNIRANYGNADYDVRHYISASFVLTDMFRHAGFHYGPNRIFGGWTLSSNWFFRTGLPFTVIDNANFGALLGYNYQGSIFASPLGNVPNTCNNAVNSPCLTAAQFAPSGALTGFGTIGRNTVYGPHFFDVDLALMKDVKITEHVMFSFGAQAYNLFNHTNFDQPVADIANPQFGSSIAAVGPPTSLLGSFVGAGSSPRFVEIKGSVRF
jgi:Carboxypeptidase regulatory-like domain/TonB-dependent Receptor Plug Domain